MENSIYKSKEYDYFDSALAELLYVVIEFALVGILVFLIKFGIIPSGSLVSTLASLVVEFSFFATVLIVSKARKKSFLEATRLNKKITTTQGFLILAISVITLYGFSPLTNSFMSVLDVVGYNSDSSFEIGSWARYFFYIFSVCAVPAFCEEMLFRGLIYNGLRTWNKKAAVFVSALLFMLMHGSPDQTMHQFLLGIVLAMLFAVTGSIWASMLLHFLNNFIALTASFVLEMLSTGSVATEETAAEVASVSALSLILSLFIALSIGFGVFVLLRMLIKSMKKPDEKTETITQKSEPQTSELALAAVGSKDDSTSKEIDNSPIAEPFSEKMLENEVKDLSGMSTSKKHDGAAIALFVISGLYLVYEWLSAFLSGIGF